MRKLFRVFIVCFLFSVQGFPQIDQIKQLNEQNVGGFTKPLVTTIGSGVNSAAFYTAKVSGGFSFSIGIRGMLISVPDNQRTFNPTLPAGYNANEPSPTFWGQKGGKYYAGKDGYIVMPGGVNEQTIPLLFPQVTLGFSGSEVLFRFMPGIKAGDENVSLLGFGIKHSISKYMPLFPLDVAVQFLYSRVEFSDIAKGNSFAFNAVASKTLKTFTAYGGIQYEVSTLDLNYNYDPYPNRNYPEPAQIKSVSVNVTGSNHFRFILGAAVKISAVIINADMNFGAQNVYTTGISFEL